MKKHLFVDVYDDEGVKRETVEGEFDGEELKAEMSRVMSEDGIPVVREKDDILDQLHELLQPKARPMTLAWRVGNVSFHAEGAAEDVAEADTQFRANLQNLLATVKSQKNQEQ